MKVSAALLSEALENERIDSQFFYPEYVRSFKAVIRDAYDTLSKISHVADGNHMTIAEKFDTSNGIRYLRGQDLNKDMMLQDRNVVYIPESSFASMKKSHVHKDDILVTIVGANTGLVGLVFDPPEKLAANCKLGIVRIDKSKILPGYLYSFLASQYGQHQILRSIRGGGQTGLILPDLRQLKIRRFSKRFERTINDIVFLGHSKIATSEEIYTQAQALLLAELGLDNWQPKHRLSFVKNASDVEEAARIDAEYFQPKYDEIVEAIKKYAGGWDKLGNLVTLKKSVEVGSKEYLEVGIPFVRVSNLSAFEFSEEKHISKKLYTELVQHQPQKGEILLSKDGSPGIAFHLREKPQNMIVSGGILRLTLKDKRLNADYLALLLNSLAVQAQVNRDVGGSVISHWRPAQVKDMLIPILSADKQHEIQQKVSESFALRAKSKKLLAAAKRAVEIAIEEDEEKALEWLKDHTDEQDET